ncbi:hypothetical protein GCM10022395_18090 [Snuella lapsa]|uniref:Uncharacterized protein n=1 Tax=Snuella lapsa TaxID=870481 RepID=A0ABP6XL27_9FLAO
MKEPILYLTKTVRFLLSIFIITDILIFIRYLLKDYGEKLIIENINKTVVIFGSITVILAIIDFILVRKYNKDAL